MYEGGGGGDSDDDGGGDGQYHLLAYHVPSTVPSAFMVYLSKPSQPLALPGQQWSWYTSPDLPDFRVHAFSYDEQSPLNIR